MCQPALTEEATYALFRSAIVDGSADAWNALHQQLNGLLIGWARGPCLRNECSESPEDIAAQAFGRAWAALSTADFSQFPTLSSLLAYLRRCVQATVIDARRAMTCRERLFQISPMPPEISPEQEVITRELSAEVWQLLISLNPSEQEWIVVYASYVLGWPPRQIWQRYRSRFASVEVIYSVKRNLLTRLARCERLRQLYCDQRAEEA